MNQELLKKAGHIIARHAMNSGLSDIIPFCALGMIDHDGAPTVSAITAMRSEGLRWVTFSAELSGNKVKRLALSNKASVCFLSETYNISLVGTIEILTDSATKKENWCAALSQHFSGPDDQNFCVLKFCTKRYNLLIDWQEARGEV